MTRIEEESGEVTKTCYNNVTKEPKACPGWIYPYARLPSFVEVRSPVEADLSRVRVRRTDYLYRAPRWMNHAVYAVEVDRITENTFEGPPSDTDLIRASQVHRIQDLALTTTRRFTFDSMGNLAEQHETLEGNGETVQTDVFRRYENRGVPYYRVGLLTEEEVNRQRTGANMQKRKTRFTSSDRGALTSRTLQPDGGDDQRLLLTLDVDPNSGRVRYSEVVAANLPTARTNYFYDEDGVHLRRRAP